MAQFSNALNSPTSLRRFYEIMVFKRLNKVYPQAKYI